MRARVPLDVDLEDRLIYGLTPTRFGYLVIGGLTAMASWYSLPTPELARGISGALVLGVAAGIAWGRLRGRTFDAWLADIVRFHLRNYELQFDGSPFRRAASAPVHALQHSARWIGVAAQWLVAPISASG
jgi:hypothetical protein